MEDIEVIAKEAELLIKAMTRKMLEKNEADFRIINPQEPIWLEKNFPFVTYDEAFDILDKHKEEFTTPVDRDEGFTKEQELFLVERNGNVPMFVVKWPKKSKPFYMREARDDPTKVRL